MARSVAGRTVLGQLVSNSLDENEHDDDGETLTDEEIIGNIFIFITAGYESSYFLPPSPKIPHITAYLLVPTH